MDTTPRPKVLDLSHYDDVQDKFAGAVAFGIRGIVNKVTEGLGGHDKSFDWRRGPAKDAGLLYGAYHFLRPGRLSQQADWFVQNIGDPSDLHLMADFEVAGISLADVQTFMGRVKALVGRYPSFYSYSAFMGERFTKADIADPFWKQVRPWVAAYNTHPTWPACWAAPWLWQYTGDGNGQKPHNVPGIVIEGGNGIDINSYAGTDDELAAEWAA